MNEINKAREVLFNCGLDDIKANRHMVPYCVRWLESGKAIFLNRDYYPIGEKRGSKYRYIDYDKYGSVGFDSRAVPGLDHDHYQHYFWSDSNPPWECHIEAYDVLSQIDEIAAAYALLTVGDNNGKSH